MPFYRSDTIYLSKAGNAGCLISETNTPIWGPLGSLLAHAHVSEPWEPVAATAVPLWVLAKIPPARANSFEPEPAHGEAG